LVYQILKSSKISLSYKELTEKIADYLGVARAVLERASFLDTQDDRLVRLHDGTFQLRENLEDVINESKKKVDGLEQSLSQTREEVENFKQELAYIVSQFARAEQEREEARERVRFISEEVDKTKAERDEALRQVERVNTQLHESKKELENLRQLIQTANEKITNLQAQAKVLEGEREEARHWARYFYSQYTRLVKGGRQ
jgi:chromosome segregation ATPase